MAALSHSLVKVIQIGGWGIVHLELRGVELTAELMNSIVNLLENGRCRFLELICCSGWGSGSSGDVQLQLELCRGIRASPSLEHVKLQRTVLPPAAGIAFIDAVKGSPRLRSVVLECCPFVTPKYLELVRRVLSAKTSSCGQALFVQP
jgi:hypothetical protein